MAPFTVRAARPQGSWRSLREAVWLAIEEGMGWDMGVHSSFGCHPKCCYCTVARGGSLAGSQISDVLRSLSRLKMLASNWNEYEIGKCRVWIDTKELLRFNWRHLVILIYMEGHRQPSSDHNVISFEIEVTLSPPQGTFSWRERQGKFPKDQ